MTPSAIGRWGSNFPKIDPVTPVADGQLVVEAFQAPDACRR